MATKIKFISIIFNFKIKVPELTGFWLLTLIIELPLSIFILIVVWFIQILIPLQFALEIIHIVFILLEIIFGYIALRTLARYQISRFHYKQFDLTENNKNNDTNDNDGNEFTRIQNLKAGDITTLHVNKHIYSFLQFNIYFSFLKALEKME